MKKLILIFALSFLFLLSGCSKKYTVSFETNGAGTIESREVTDGQLGELPILTKIGYEFKGWFTNQELTTKYEGQEIKSNMTLYAKWEILKFEVKFIDHEGKELKKEIVEYGKAATAPTLQAREGYTFGGWDKAFSNITANVTIKTVYQINKYTVKFYDHDGTQIGDEVTVEWGKSVSPPSNPTREGYKFTGWDKPLDNVKSDLVITATYEAEKYTVTFKDHNGTVLKEDKNVEFGKPVTAPQNPTREGYTFSGWDKEFTEVKSNLVVTAKYTPIKYTIKFYDGETLLEFSPETYDITQSVNLTTYEKSGFTFVGWYTDAELTQEIKTIAVGSKGNVVVYGKWLNTSLKYNIVYELNGGQWSWDQVTITDPAKGIDKDSELPEMFMEDFFTYLKDNNLLNSSLVHSNLRKTTWTEFKANYNDPVAIYNHTSTNTASATDGYSQFFYTSATGDTATGLITSIEGGFLGTEPYKTKYANLTQFIAYMVQNRYSNSYFWSGGTGKSLGGFVLDGYFYGTQGVGTGGFPSLRASLPNTNIKITYTSNLAKATNVDYQVTEYVQGLSAKLVAPTRLGYAFRGWYTNPEFTGEVVNEIKSGVTPAATYYAKWELIQ